MDPFLGKRGIAARYAPFFGMGLFRIGENMGPLEFHPQGQDLPGMLGDAVQLLLQNLYQMPVAGDAQQGGACAAEAEACPGGAHQGLDFVIVGDQAFAVALVEPVLHGGAQ